MAGKQLLLGTVFGAPTQVPLEIVGATIATTPPNQGSDSGNDIIIPVPDGTEEGDLLIALLSLNELFPLQLIRPIGWDSIRVEIVPSVSGAFAWMQKIIVPSSVPSEYTWIWGGDAGVTRSGCMIGIRGAKAPLGEDGYTSGTLTIPDLTNNVEGSILAGFCTVAPSASTVNNYGVNSPLTLQGRHVADSNVPYAAPRATACASEEDLSVEVISGRSFTHTTNPATQHGTFGIIVEPA